MVRTSPRRAPVTRIPVVLSIAGSDSGGGAGIQADLKAFAHAGVHGTTAITALTAQNTQGVTGIHPVPPDFVVEQVRAVATDLGVGAVKIGMLGDAPVIEAVAKALDELDEGTPVVVDPVMVAESGARLLPPDAEQALIDLILPRATVVTPNMPEARALTRRAAPEARGGGREEEDEAAALARAVHALGPAWVVLTGGHRREATDLVWNGRDLVQLPGERHPDGAAHGSGCTHSSTLAAHLAKGDDPLEAARAAKRAASEAVRNGLRELGQGAGPVDVLGLRSATSALP